MAPFYQPSLLEDNVIINKVVKLCRKLLNGSSEETVDTEAQSTAPVRAQANSTETKSTEPNNMQQAAPPKTQKTSDNNDRNNQDVGRDEARAKAIEESREICKQYDNALARDQHNVSRKLLSPNAIRVLHRLQDRGYEAYLVGGCIRDILMGLKPKDFDVATNATPEQIKACFNNCRLIGRRFRLAHVMFGREVIEVATFRGHHQGDVDQAQTQKQAKTSNAAQSTEGQLLRDNVYGTIEEDAQRRDFTINALYYSVKGFYIRDFAGGVEAIKAKRIELIGDPESRYREDPVRMLRAIRFATKLDMTIEEKTEQPIYELGSLLGNIPPARLFEESMKLTLAGKAEANYLLMRKYDLFRHMFPVPYEVLDQDPDCNAERLVRQMFINTDNRINSNKRVTPAYIHAALLWYVVEKETKMQMEENGLTAYDAGYIAMTEVLARHCRSISLPKRFSTVSRDIWQLQHRLARRSGKRAFRLMEHPKFRAGYDFLLLRGDIEGGEIKELATWWTDFQNADEQGRQQMAYELNGSQGKKPAPVRHRNRGSSGSGVSSNSTGKSEQNSGNNSERKRRPRRNNRGGRRYSDNRNSDSRTKTNNTNTDSSQGQTT